MKPRPSAVAGFTALASALLTLVSCASPRDRDGGATTVRFVDAAHEGGTAAHEGGTATGSTATGTVAVSGLPVEVTRGLRAVAPTRAAWQTCFAVHTVREDGALGQPPIVGEYGVADGVASFRPRFPPAAGMTHRARVDRACLARLAGASEAAVGAPAWLEATWTSPVAVADAPRVVAVYPSAAEVPANLLKFYIHFSVPMARGDAYDHIRLIDVETETAVEAPFLALGEELWDDTHQRFTLFFDPGRIKRGLRPHKEAGPPLAAGKRYRLEIAPSWASATGALLDERHVKGFGVVADDRAAPSVDAWAITAPSADSRDPVEVDFGEPLDHALLDRVIQVRGPDGASVAGRVMVGPGETSWRLVPDAPWSKGVHRLEAETILEDLAGNNLNGVFDREVSTQGVPSKAKTVEIPFVIEPI